MSRKALLRLVAGFRRFREKYYDPDTTRFRKLAQGQTPKTLLIGCCDSRVDPALITEAEPGELFVVRNVANLVPPYESGGGQHGVSAAIEFAVLNLKVENIIVLGHRQCGGIRSLITGLGSDTPSFISQWMNIAAPARERVLAAHPGASDDVLCAECEREAIRTSLQNLRTFPFVEQAICERGLSMFGAYFDLEAGELYELVGVPGEFQRIELTKNWSLSLQSQF